MLVIQSCIPLLTIIGGFLQFYNRITLKSNAAFTIVGTCIMGTPPFFEALTTLYYLKHYRNIIKSWIRRVKQVSPINSTHAHSIWRGWKKRIKIINYLIYFLLLYSGCLLLDTFATLFFSFYWSTSETIVMIGFSVFHPHIELSTLVVILPIPIEVGAIYLNLGLILFKERQIIHYQGIVFSPGIFV